MHVYTINETQTITSISITC